MTPNPLTLNLEKFNALIPPEYNWRLERRRNSFRFQVIAWDDVVEYTSGREPTPSAALVNGVTGFLSNMGIEDHDTQP